MSAFIEPELGTRPNTMSGMRAFCLLLAGMVCLPCFAPGQVSVSRLSEDLRRADALQEEGKVKEARQVYERVLKQIPDSETTEPRAHILNGLSNTYAADGDFEKAADFARRAAEIYRTISDTEGEAYALNNLGIATLVFFCWSAQLLPVRRLLPK